MSELKPCVMCGSKHRDLMGYDFHKVSCSNDECPISHLALRKDQWQERIETETDKRLTAIATKHATRTDELSEKLEQVIYCSDNNTGHEPSLSCFQRAIEEARETLDKSRIEAEGK